MSEAEKRNGRRVEAAARQIQREGRMNSGGFMTVGEVCELCEMSAPTVTKYLEAMFESGIMERFTIASRQRIYRFI